jgi:methionyl-tRNA formyltransferase
MDLVFFGTPEYSRLHLEALHRRHRVRLAVTRPDRPAGRHGTPQPSPVKRFCLDAGIPVAQPESARDPGLIAALESCDAPLGVVVAYGGYLPGPLLDTPRHGFVNVHPSLLPKYRGAAPANWALIRGETTTGVSIIRVTTAMDAGPILGQRLLPIAPDETAGSLLERSTPVGIHLLLEVIEAIGRGEAVAVPQDDSLATLAPRLAKEDGRIDWNRPAAEIVALVRGVTPWPGGQAVHDGTRVTVLRARAVPGSGEPGRVLAADAAGGLVVAAGAGAVSLELLQKEGGRPLPAADFLRGARWRTGDRLVPPGA